MDYAVVLYFDAESQARLLGMMEDLVRTGVNRYLLDGGIRPHITLAYWNGQQENDVSAEIKRYAQAVKGTKVLFSSIGIFRPTRKWSIYLP